MMFCGADAIQHFDIAKMQKLNEAIALGLVIKHPTGYELTVLGAAVWAAEEQMR